MAEIVQLHLEGAIPELEQLKRVGLFTRDEIRSVIRKRKELEYKLQRKVKSKEAYLKYIQYEISLLSLIKKRRQKINYHFKKKEVDYAMAMRISKLFKVAVYRFQSDIKLWISYIEFCKRMAWKHTIGELFARMLQVHNKDPALWVTAAKWELEENATDNARNLLQRALRFHPRSRLLWLEYYKMELLYAEQIRKRREILGVDCRQKETTEDAIVDGQISMLIYNRAVEEIPDVEFALSFLPVCRKFDFTRCHQEQIFKDVEARHPDKEETWDALARRWLDGWSEPTPDETEEPPLKGSKRSFMTYETAIEKLSTEKMWHFYIQMALERLQAAESERAAKKRLRKVQKLARRAEEAGLLSRGHFVEWARLLNSCGQASSAGEAMLRAARRWPNDVDLWLLCLRMHLLANLPEAELSTLFEEAFKSVEKKVSLPLWELAIEWKAIVNPTQIFSLLEKGLETCPEVGIPLKTTYLEVTAQQKGIEEARVVYKRLCKTKPLSLPFYHKMTAIENCQVEPSIKWLRRCYEDAILEAGDSDVDIWLSYVQLESSHPKGKVSGVSSVYWRALKMLPSDLVDNFISRYSLLYGSTAPLNGDDSNTKDESSLPS